MVEEGTQPAAEPTRRERRRTWMVAFAIFFGLLAVYHANVTVLDEGDAVPNINLPLTLLQNGWLSFTPDHFPEMFKWKSRPPFVIDDDFYFVTWRETFGDRTAEEWKKSGHLEYNGPRYYVVKSPERGVYVSTFGPVPGFTLLPLMAIVHGIDPDVVHKFTLKLAVAKLHGAALVSATAILLFFISLRFTTRRRAALIAGLFGVGTCAWAISSQNIWQQTVNMLFLSLGTFFFVRGPDRPFTAALAGFWFGAAMACRPTAVLMLGAVGVYLLIRHKKSLPAFALGVLPIPLLVAVYNTYYFGSPFSFAQELVGHMIAEKKTGSPDLWQSSLLEGLAGLLVSPSRGLIVFTPFLALSGWGIARIWRRPDYDVFRPLTVAALLTMMLQTKWFDWWGGWAYGYRPWLDEVPFLTLFLLPVLDPVLRTRPRQAVLAVVVAWSVFVQALGAFSYDRTWNARRLYVVRLPTEAKPLAFTDVREAKRFADERDGKYIGPTWCDVDLTFCRYRLWSIEDSLIVYQLTHFDETRSRRMPSGWHLLGG